MKKQASVLGVTEAEVIRRAIDGQMAYLIPGVRDLSAWEREKRFIVERMSGRSGVGPRQADEIVWNRF